MQRILNVFICNMFLCLNALAQEPLFQSDVISTSTPEHQVKIDVDISGAKDLYLVVTDAGDGMTFDWCDWIEPKLVGDAESKDLTELKWKHARSGWGTVQVGKNCNGGSLSVYGKTYDKGIGTHANSLIHYELPEDHKFKKFTCLAGLDAGGVNQENQSTRETVKFLVFTAKPAQEYWDGLRGGTSTANHEAAKAIEQFDIHPELDVTLFASEPMLVNPTNIDIDHLGRVWVCEVVNYRGKRETRPEGDRILVLEDTDQDGRADKSTVFYQGRDIDSVHGVCVLGNRVIVSAGSEVFSLYDDDGDLKADRKEVMFTGISGKQHDHGIHAIVFGPDGKLYFNFGNEGRQIRDKDGNPITDVSGNVVSEQTRPYQQGMIFRCSLDGSHFETLAWNFRNNWEVCVDSFGRMWQSDNDDDGNKAVRINYVMPFGNYGFRDEMTRAGWRTPRIGMTEDIPSRHWYQNDPGVVPNLLQTGAGSPTGICIYEGDALPEVFHNQIIHCDAGPNVVRAYVTEPDGAGFKARIVNIMDGSKHNQWFRPSDVCVAPDGSLIVADWYDPGVGGHGMGDVQRGRLFRITAKGKSAEYTMPKYEFITADMAAEVLASPNQAARYLAWQALLDFKYRSARPLKKMTESDNPRLAARALWILCRANSTYGISYPQSLLEHEDPAVRAMAVRVLMRYPLNSKDRFFDEYYSWWKDESAQVKRELLIGLSQRNRKPGRDETRQKYWRTFAEEFDTNDRWYVEALGIAAEDHWNECMGYLSNRRPAKEVWHEIVWRSRSRSTPDWLAEIILDEEISATQAPRFMRAFDFQDESVGALSKLAEHFNPMDDEKSQLVFIESVKRLPDDKIVPSIAIKLGNYLENCEDQHEFIQLVSRFKIAAFNDRLLQIAEANATSQLGVDAIQVAIQNGAAPDIGNRISEADDEKFEAWANVLQRARPRESIGPLRSYIEQLDNPLERRKRFVLALGKTHNGAREIVKWVETKSYDDALEPAISAALHGTNWSDITVFARREFPLPGSDGNARPRPVTMLLRFEGDAVRGKELFNEAGTCAKCHVVNGHGTEVGPDLSEIGSKLSKEALFQNVLFPSAAISHGYENWSVLTLDGEMFSGVKVSDSDEFVELKDAEGIVRRIEIEDIDEIKQQKLSLMPDDLPKDLTDKDLIDIVAYMMTLKKNP